MNHRLKKALALALLGGGLAIAGSALAQTPQFDTVSKTALQRPGAAHAPTSFTPIQTQGATTSYQTGFEAPDFTPGALINQQGWWGIGTGVNVRIDRPATGTQHVGMISIESPSSGTSNSAWSPEDLPKSSEPYFALSANIRMSRTGDGAYWSLTPQDPDSGSVSTIVRFTGAASRDIQIADFSQGFYVATGASWPVDTYFNFKILMNRTTGALRLCMDGVQIHEELTDNSTGSPEITEFLIAQVQGSGQTAGNTLDFDDVVLEYTDSFACSAGAATHTVTPSVGTGDGTISPNTDQTVNDGDTATFTLAPDTGFEIDTVGGDCPAGSFAGNDYTTGAITADCEVIANFKAVASAGNDLRISQIYGGGGSADPSFNRDYVEVFNSSASAVDLSGWSIQYAGASGSSWAPVALSGSVAPGGYYLVGLATGTTGAALPTPDATGTTAMSASDGKVALVNTTTALSGSCPTGAQIIDLVGYGTANCYEGTAAAPKLSKTEAAFRADDGCTDTDDNAADFSKATPSPRNSSSPAHTCGTPIITHTVTSSVGTPSGTITPSGAQTVNDGDPITFTLAADTDFEIDDVGGDCPAGSLSGNDYTTGAIVADCEVIANFKPVAPSDDVVCSGPINHLIATDIDGTSINWSTGAIVDDGPSTGYDFNPYGTGGKLAFYWAQSTVGAGVANAASGTGWLVLGDGDIVGPSSLFSRSTGYAPNWEAGADGYLGFKFDCSSIPGAPVSGLCYGYAHMTTTGPNGFPATLVDYCYDKSGAEITIVGGGSGGTVPVVTKSFTPETMGQHDTSVVTITLSNPTATDALLTAPLVDNLPAGLEVVSGSGSTDCLVGMGLQQGPSPMASVTLPAGAKIPANGSCSVSFSVTATGGGTYTNLIAAGELQTDQGNNDSDASATLTVLSDPTIEVDPTSLTETLASDATSTQTLTIKNLGDSDLNWTIEETGPRPHQPVVGGGGQAERQSARVSTPSAPFVRDFTLAPMAEAIQDGGFELGSPNPYWDEDSLNFGGVLCDMSCSNSPDNAPHSGNWWVWFGGVDAYETGYVSQAVTIPAGSASLSFWLRVPFSSGLAADYMAVSVDGTELWRVTANDSGAYTAAYQQVTVDVSAYADGGSHTVRFNSVVNGGGPETSNFMLDDVSLETGGSSGGSCANATDIPWLSVDIDSGTTTALSSDTVTVSFDATGLAPDTYQANLCVASNDPATPQAMVPVELTVTSNGTTFDVTSSVATGSGTITPNGTITVDAYETLSFTLTPGTGYLIDSVTGTCIGTLTGDTFVTDPITGDCTVEANFSAIPLPSIVVSPTSLSFTAMQGTTDTDTLSVTNEGPGVLDYTITRATTSFAPNPAERGNLSKATAVRTPVADDLISAAARGDGSLLHNGPVFFANDPSCEVGTPGLVIHDDDNLPDNGYGWNPSAGTDPKMVDKFTPTSYPMTYNTVCVTFLSLTGLTSAPVKVLVYADDGAGGAPGTLLGSVDATANNIGGGLEQSYQAIDVSSMGLNITSGSVYIGFEWNPAALDANGDNLFIASSESSSTFADGYSWTATDGWGPTVDVRPNYRALFIRAIEGTTGPVLPGCDNPSHIPWLAVAPTSGSISGFGTNNHTVTANAAGMSPGTYEALICVNSNDPAFPQVEVNVSFTVTADPALADIFSDDFEGDAPEPNDDIVTGSINVSLIQSVDGSTFDFVTGLAGTYSDSRVDDINLYDFGDGMYVYWYGDATSLSVGGVIDGSGEFAVLNSGATIGPGSSFNAASVPMLNWTGGADGYLGIAFENESTGELNYGYIHMTTTGPDGYPGQWLEYAYDKTGAAITIP